MLEFIFVNVPPAQGIIFMLFRRFQRYSGTVPHATQSVKSRNVWLLLCLKFLLQAIWKTCINLATYLSKNVRKGSKSWTAQQKDWDILCNQRKIVLCFQKLFNGISE